MKLLSSRYPEGNSGTTTNDLGHEPPPEFSLTLPFSSFVHHLSRPNTHVLTQTTLKITEWTHTPTHVHRYMYIQTSYQELPRTQPKEEGKGGASVLCVMWCNVVLCGSVSVSVSVSLSFSSHSIPITSSKEPKYLLTKNINCENASETICVLCTVFCP